MELIRACLAHQHTAAEELPRLGRPSPAKEKQLIQDHCVPSAAEGAKSHLGSFTLGQGGFDIPLVRSLPGEQSG